MKIQNVFGHMKSIQKILTLVQNKFVKSQKKNLFSMKNINLMKLNNFIKSMKSIIISHSSKKLRADRFLKNFNFLNKKIQGGPIKYKIMTLNQTVHQLKTQITFKLTCIPENVEIFLDYRSKNLIFMALNNISKIKRQNIFRKIKTNL